MDHLVQAFQDAPWWRAALLSEWSLLCMAVAAVAMAGVVLLGRALMHLRGGRGRLAATREAGTATVEFALVFPIVLFLMLTLIQTTLLMAGNLFVHYSAFAATRSAITQIPRDLRGLGGEGPNAVIAVGSAKLEAIRRSAYFAVVPACGRLESAGIATDDFVGGLRRYFASSGQAVPRWVDTLAADRLRYAAANTTVQLLETLVVLGHVQFNELPAREEFVFGPKDPVTVRVRHRLNLSIPYARALFADGRHDTAVGRGAYADVTAQFTLTNEGFDPALPPPPPLPRDP
jgi:hypothetical protein